MDDDSRPRMEIPHDAEVSSLPFRGKAQLLAQGGLLPTPLPRSSPRATRTRKGRWDPVVAAGEPLDGPQGMTCSPLACRVGAYVATAAPEPETTMGRGRQRGEALRTTMWRTGQMTWGVGSDLFLGYVEGRTWKRHGVSIFVLHIANLLIHHVPTERRAA